MYLSIDSKTIVSWGASGSVVISPIENVKSWLYEREKSADVGEVGIESSGGGSGGG